MRTLILPDIHAPYHWGGTLALCRTLKKRLKPDRVVCIGDLADQHGWSQYEREPDSLGQGTEDLATLAFCRELYSIFPRVLACVGNHDCRLAKRAARAGLPSRLHLTISDMYQSPAGWEWADRHVIDSVVYQHGEGFSGAQAALKAAVANRQSTVIGHVHSAAGVAYASNGVNRIFGMSVGCLIDVEAPAFRYGRTTAAKPVLGYGVVIDGVPHFEPV